MLSLKEGEKLIGIARKAIELSFEDKGHERWDVSEKALCRKAGVFVTLHYLKGRKKELRGCIGFIKSKIPLWEAVSEAAKLAAFDDPRFPPLIKEDLEKIRIEISVLTEKKMIETKEIKKPEEILRQIEIGKDGLIVEYSGFSGILLPQVAIEHGWDAEHFLEQTCIKAGVSPKDWKNKSCKICKFQCQIFSEK